jgi:FkbM family methyltransferase
MPSSSTVQQKKKAQFTVQNSTGLVEQLNLQRWQVLSEALLCERLPSIVDVGANPLDEPVYRPFLDAGLCSLHGFEPQNEAFQELVANKGERETYHNLAVGDGQAHPLHIYRQSGLTSIFPLDDTTTRFLGRNAKRARLIAKERIDTVTLDGLEDIPNIDLLKIDVQGAETMIFNHGKQKLSKSLIVISELRFFPMYEGEPLLDAQIAALSALGLRFHKFLFVKDQQIANSQSARLKGRVVASQALDGDAVFVRDLRDADTVSTEQIKTLALLADAILQSYDLALHCLDLLAERGELGADVAARYVELLPAQVKRMP